MPACSPEKPVVARNDDSSYYDSEYESENDENEELNKPKEVTKLDLIKEEWLRIQ